MNRKRVHNRIEIYLGIQTILISELIDCLFIYVCASSVMNNFDDVGGRVKPAIIALNELNT